MAVVWSKHARERAVARSGRSLYDLSNAILTAIASGQAYSPNEKARDPAGEWWVVCDGPKGAATAIVVRRNKHYLVITLRESETCGQGERANKPLTFKLGDKLP